MYCIKCGKKIPDNTNYCTKCGHKASDIKIDSTSTNQDNDLPIIIGFICLICSFFINILILPVAIYGLVIGIKNKKVLGIILNIISIMVSILLFLLLVFVFSQINKYVKAIAHEINQKHYEYNYDEQKPKEDNIIVKDLIGTWYLYDNNKLSTDTYYVFNNDNTYTFINDQDKYAGTYKITKYNNYEDTKNKGYKIVMKNIALIKNNGTAITENIDDFNYIIYIEKDSIQVKDINTNNYFTLKKDISLKY